MGKEVWAEKEILGEWVVEGCFFFYFRVIGGGGCWVEREILREGV